MKKSWLGVVLLLLGVGCGSEEAVKLTPLKITCSKSSGDPCNGMGTSRLFEVFLVEGDCTVDKLKEGRMVAQAQEYFQSSECTSSLCTKTLLDLYSPANSSAPIYQYPKGDYKTCVLVDRGDDGLLVGSDAFATQ